MTNMTHYPNTYEPAAEATATAMARTTPIASTAAAWDAAGTVGGHSKNVGLSNKFVPPPPRERYEYSITPVEKSKNNPARHAAAVTAKYTKNGPTALKTAFLRGVTQAIEPETAGFDRVGGFARIGRSTRSTQVTHYHIIGRNSANTATPVGSSADSTALVTAFNSLNRLNRCLNRDSERINTLSELGFGLRRDKQVVGLIGLAGLKSKRQQGISAAVDVDVGKTLSELGFVGLVGLAGLKRQQQLRVGVAVAVDVDVDFNPKILKILQILVQTTARRIGGLNKDMDDNGVGRDLSNNNSIYSSISAKIIGGEGVKPRSVGGLMRGKR